MCNHKIFIALFFCVLWGVSSALAAGGVRVRGGEHKAYSRLVFDWTQPVSYTLESLGGGRVRLDFDTAATLDQSGLNVKTLRYVSGVKMLSSNPLSVEIAMTPGMAVSDFKLGQRVVLDFKSQSKPAGEGQPPEPMRINPPDDLLQSEAPAAKSVPIAQPDPKPKAQPKPQDKPKSEAIQQPAPVPAAKQDTVVKLDNQDVKIPSQSGLKAPEGRQKTSQAVMNKQAARSAIVMESRQEGPAIDPSIRHPNLVMMTSVSPTSMAAFILDNRLWLVNDQENFLLSPHVVGEQKDDFGTPELIEHDAGKIFTVQALSGADYIAQGGGLAWRILVGHDLKPETSPITPVRQAVDARAARGGQVFWAMPEVGEILQVPDPVSGVMLSVVTVEKASMFAGAPLEFVDFKTLESPLGLAIWPKVDDLAVEAVDGGVVVYRTGGAPLAVSDQGDIETALKARAKPADNAKDDADDQGQSHRKERRLFNFENWQLGGVEGLAPNKAVILSTLPGLTRDGQVEGLMNLARMYISNGMGAEADGFLNLAQDLLPSLASSPEFKALQGVAQALNNHYADAFKLLSIDMLKDRDEVRYWRSYALAKLYDWQQAASLLPPTFADIHLYPPEIAAPLSLTLAEVTLRAGDTVRTQELFSILNKFTGHPAMRAPYQVAFSYLKGELARQQGELDKALDIWGDLADSPDDLYRVRAGLALTRLEQEERDLSDDAAIDRLERLRYAWRGDDLEAQVNYWLGRIYFDSGEFVKGLNIMRDAASYATGVHLGQRITSDMTEEFQNLYLSKKLYKLSGPDVAALYEHFAELVPTGKTGDLIGRRLADRLVQANLYDRAIELLTHQLDTRLQGEDAYRVAVKLAAIYQLKDMNAESLKMLERARDIQAGIPGLAIDPDANEELTLLTARALSRSYKPAEALDILSQGDFTPEMNRLRADIAWRHGYWDDAAEALGNVIEDEQIDTDSHLTDAQADLVLQRAVALNLGGDRIRLANIREKFGAAMIHTPRARAFDVVTRLHKNAELADRDTLLSVAAEVDLFSDFIETYKTSETEDGDTDDSSATVGAE